MEEVDPGAYDHFCQEAGFLGSHKRDWICYLLLDAANCMIGYNVVFKSYRNALKFQTDVYIHWEPIAPAFITKLVLSPIPINQNIAWQMKLALIRKHTRLIVSTISTEFVYDNLNTLMSLLFTKHHSWLNYFLEENDHRLEFNRVTLNEADKQLVTLIKRFYLTDPTKDQYRRFIDVILVSWLNGEDLVLAKLML